MSGRKRPDRGEAFASGKGGTAKGNASGKERATDSGLEPELSALADDALWQRACALRREIWGSKIFLRGIVEFSNHCRQNCLYCGLRRDNGKLPRYRLGPGQILDCAGRVKALGFGTVVLQSGEDPDCSTAEIAAVISRIKKEHGLAVTLSLGERDEADYALWREAGADRYLLKAETMDAALYARLRPGKRLEQRLKTLELLRGLGYETGSGLIAGLPGAAAEIEDDIKALAALLPDMFSISPFVPHPDTPLGGAAPCGAARVLRAMARARLARPESHIPVTSALSLGGEALRLFALRVGNVLMPSLTPEEVRRAYAIYPGKNAADREPYERALEMKNALLRAGYELPPGPGGAWKSLSTPAKNT